MSCFISRNSLRFLLVMLAAWVCPRLAQAQTQYATVVPATDQGCALLVCGTIGTPLKAVDGNALTAATITPSLALSSAAVRVGFTNAVPAGARVGVLISFSGGGMNIGLLGQTSICTYNSLGGPALQDLAVASLLNMATLSSNVVLVEFPATVAFKQLELRTGGALNVLVGSYTLSLYQVTASLAPLPVELVAFAGKAHAATAALSWETASERNSAYFTVERSAGASDGFQAVGKVVAVGSSSQPTFYRFADAPPAGRNYYRLRQVDKDSTRSYSPVIAVVTDAVLALQAYPNPATEVVTVLGPVGTGFSLFNRLGQLVQQGEIPPAQTRKLDLHYLPDGVYFLRGQTAGTVVKVVKSASGAQ